MRNAFLLICLAVTGLNLQAQSREFDQLYASLRAEDGVINLYIPGFICRMAGNIAELNYEEQELLRSIRSIKLLVVENPEINRQVNLARILAMVEPDPDIFPLLRVQDDDEDVLILAREKNQRVAELYVIVGGEENVMVRICGRMDRDLMKSIFDVTGIEQTKYVREI